MTNISEQTRARIERIKNRKPCVFSDMKNMEKFEKSCVVFRDVMHRFNDAAIEYQNILENEIAPILGRIDYALAHDLSKTHVSMY